MRAVNDTGQEGRVRTVVGRHTVRDATTERGVCRTGCRPTHRGRPGAVHSVPSGADQLGVVDRELDAAPYFDPDGAQAGFEAKTSDARVATVEATEDGLLTLRGVARGVATVTVTAGTSLSGQFAVAVDGPTLVPFFPRAGDPQREGFVRVINHGSTAGTVTILWRMIRSRTPPGRRQPPRVAQCAP